MGSVVSTERFFEKYNRYTGELPPSYYHNTQLVVHGLTPESGQMTYFLHLGDIVGEEKPWGKAVYHIPKATREDVTHELGSLLDHFAYWVDPRRGRNGQIIGERVTIMGPQLLERGRPVVLITRGVQGDVERINFTRRGGQRLRVPAPPSETMLYLPRRDSVRQEEPALI